MVNDTTYDPLAHRNGESYRYQKDMKLADIITMFPEKFPTLELTNEDGILCFVYNPFSEDMKEILNVQYTALEALDGTKSNFYEKESNGTISWYYRAIHSSIEEIFRAKLYSKWIEGLKYRNNSPDFCKDVVKIIRYCPHENIHTYGMYIDTFVSWLEEIETDEIAINNIIDTIIENMKYVFYKNVYEGYEREGTLMQNVLKKSARLTIQDCSKKAHGLLKQIDWKGSKSIENIMERKKRAQLAIQQRLNPIKNLAPKVEDVPKLEQKPDDQALFKKYQSSKRPIAAVGGEKSNTPDPKKPRLEEKAEIKDSEDDGLTKD